jgi:hypothetical protein
MRRPNFIEGLMSAAAQSQLTAFMQGMSELPFGWIGIVAMMLVAAGAFALGQIAFVGLEFLTHWPLVLGGWFAGLSVLSAIWGAGMNVSCGTG